jgi:hypothetical protein
MNYDEHSAPSLPTHAEPTAAVPCESLVSRLVVDGPQAKTNLDDFVSGVELLPYLEAEPSILITWPGHPTSICKILAGIWQTEPLVQTKDGQLVFPDPARHFDIHFELQVQQWRKRMALFLHFETRPYFSGVKLKSKTDPSSLEQYLHRRHEFIAEMTALGQLPGFKISTGTVQIGKAVYDFDGKTAEEARAWLQPVIDEVACTVNHALHRVDQRRRAASHTLLNTSIADLPSGTVSPI